MNSSYSPEELFLLIRKYLIAIIISGLIFAAGGYFYAKHKTVVSYTASRTLLINHDEQSERPYSQLQTDMYMMPTYKRVLEDPAALKSVNQKMKKVSGYKGTSAELRGDLKFKPVENTVALKVSAEQPTEKLAVKLADVAAKETRSALLKKFSNVGRVTMLADAEQNTVSTEQNVNAKKFVVLAGVLGAFVGALVMGVVTFFRNRKTKSGR